MNKLIKNSVLIVLPAENFNEQEFLSVKKSLINSGFNIFIASDAPVMCKGMKGLSVKADVNFFNMKEPSFAGIVFIGGTGVVNYFKNISLFSIIRKFDNAGKTVAAVCGAPVILANAGILENKKASCYPDLKEVIIDKNANYLAGQVVVDGNIITAPDPSSAIEFGQAIVEQLKNS
ncbi:MAG: DJ-1/PfpI family protein [Rhodothermaceae bacterium]